MFLKFSMKISLKKIECRYGTFDHYPSANPYAPSIHMHISWTELKSGKGTWRIMADLNPSIASDDMKVNLMQL